MSVLRSIEQKIEGLFEGLFGRAFRTNVQPVELARKLVKEMEDHRTVSVSRVYVPNEYTVYLSPPTASSSPSYEGSLSGRAPGLPRRARPARGLRAAHAAGRVLIETDDDLSIGEFGIATRMVQGGSADRRRRPATPRRQRRARRDDDLQAARTAASTPAASAAELAPRAGDRDARRSTASGTRWTSRAS